MQHRWWFVALLLGLAAGLSVGAAHAALTDTRTAGGVLNAAPALVTSTPTPTHTTTEAPTPTDTPMATPKDPNGDTDGDTILNSADPDDDNDGCLDTQELGDDELLGGRRDPHSFWDFMDVWTGVPLSRDRSVVTSDISGVVGRFGTIRESTPTKQEALAEALTQPTDLTSYHAAFDRSGADPAAEPWNLRPPDGSIVANDISALVAQFGHTCA